MKTITMQHIIKPNRASKNETHTIRRLGELSVFQTFTTQIKSRYDKQGIATVMSEVSSYRFFNQGGNQNA
jgi:hypothetical protein